MTMILDSAHISLARFSGVILGFQIFEAGRQELVLANVPLTVVCQVSWFIDAYKYMELDCTDN